jgi:hypothetical protein
VVCGLGEHVRGCASESDFISALGHCCRRPVSLSIHAMVSLSPGFKGRLPLVTRYHPQPHPCRHRITLLHHPAVLDSFFHCAWGDDRDRGHVYVIRADTTCSHACDAAQARLASPCVCARQLGRFSARRRGEYFIEHWSLQEQSSKINSRCNGPVACVEHRCATSASICSPTCSWALANLSPVVAKH